MSEFRRYSAGCVAYHSPNTGAVARMATMAVMASKSRDREIDINCIDRACPTLGEPPAPILPPLPNLCIIGVVGISPSSCNQPRYGCGLLPESRVFDGVDVHLKLRGCLCDECRMKSSRRTTNSAKNGIHDKAMIKYINAVIKLNQTMF